MSKYNHPPVRREVFKAGLFAAAVMLFVLYAGGSHGEAVFFGTGFGVLYGAPAVSRAGRRDE